ncbi:MAG TPA: hypothetical protein VMS17_15275, partial [Gemmataceae bacterium]|nr:hypothetical protein [Gemmataceae bacterium]
KIAAYVEKAPRREFTELQMEEVCAGLVELRSTRAARSFLEAAKRKFKPNPIFPYLLAQTYMTGDLDRTPLYQVRPLLEDARRLAEAMPPDRRRDKLLREIQDRLTALAAIAPFGMGFMTDFFASYFDDWDEDDEQYED